MLTYLISCSASCFQKHKNAHVEEEVKQGQAVDGTNGTHQEQDGKQSTSTNGDTFMVDVNPDPALHPANRRSHPYEAVLRDPRFKPLFTNYPSLSQQLQQIEKITWAPSRFPPINPNEVALGNAPRYASPYVKGKWEQSKADKLATRRLYEISQVEEGVSEFITLCNLVLDPDKEDIGPTDLPSPLR